MIKLENEQVKLRAPELEDVDLLYAWENNMEVWRVSNTLSPFSKHSLMRYIQNYQLDIYQTKQLRLIIEAKDQSSLMNYPVGIIDLFDYDPFHQRAGVGILIHNTEDRGKGYASEALQLLTKYAFEYLHVHQLFCNIADNNEPSLKLFSRHEFEIIGLKKDWIRTKNGWLGEYTLQKINPLALISKC